MLRKRHIILCCLSALLFVSACKTKLTQFTLTYLAALKEPVASAGLVSFDSEEMRTDCRVRFERNDTKRSKVKRIHLQKLAFTSGSQESAMQMVRNLKNIYISSPNYPEEKIAFRKLDVNHVGDELHVELRGSDQDLIDFIKQESYSMRFEFERTPGFPDDIDMQVHIYLFVEGELIKTNLYHKILV